MINFKVKGAIFDVDDTLLNNIPDTPEQGLHERSRLAAVQEVGRRRGLQILCDLSPKANLDAFLNAPVHTLEAAVWNILVMSKLATGDVIDHKNPLLQEITTLKNSFHKTLLLNEGEEVPGATDFVSLLAQNGLNDKLAIASTALRQDVDIFLDKTGLKPLFPDSRIKTKESITHPKPNPEVFNLAFTSLGLAESDRAAVCAFEDDPRGIMAARAAGLYACAITTRYPREELLSLAVPPHIAADSYDEFTKLFQLAS
ncbi:MAG: haloacid dehalogenase superfamily protein subfamily variant 3 with third motif having or [Patescibacteria group bacterium]|nr:haloacid dehalogenase superfamily protein subfamily variant 3 with third motif having or [Patescibacteria group bacterium]